MDYNENEIKWISQKMFNYQDPQTTSTLTVLMESGIIEENNYTNYCSPRITFQIRDSRVKTSKVQIELYFIELNEFVSKISSIFNNLNLKEIFEKETGFFVSKFTYKNRKDLSVKFLLIDKKPTIKFEIIDPSNSGGNKVICIDYITFDSIKQFCQQTRDNYTSVSINCMNVCLQEKILDQLKSMDHQITVATPKIIVNTPKESVIPEFEKTNTVGELQKLVSEQQKIQNELTSNLDKIELPEYESAMKYVEEEPVKEEVKESPKKHNEYSMMPFIGNIIDYSPKRLINFVDKIIFSEKDSLTSSFLPLSTIIKINDPENIDQLTDTGLLKAQLILNILTRKSIQEYLKNDKFLSFPTFKFLTSITKENKTMWRISNEILFCFAMFTILYRSYIKYLNNNINADSRKWINNILISQNVLRTYLVSFAVSIRKDNLKFVKDELINIFQECHNNGFLNELNEIYSTISCGGKLNLNQSVIEDCFGSFVKGLGSISFFSLTEIDNLLEELNVTNIEQISSEEDVKLLTIKHTIKEESSIDEKVELFLSCSLKYIDESLKNEILQKCKDYSDLTRFLREQSVPDTLLRIKRAMDINTEFTKKSEIMNFLKDFEESEEVTESRVLFEDTIEKTNVDSSNLDPAKYTKEQILSFYNEPEGKQ